MSSAPELFSKVMYRALSAFGLLYGYRQTAHTAINAAKQNLINIERLHAERIFNSGYGDKFFKDKEGFLQLVGGLEGYARSSADRRASQFLSFTEASSLVFAHSLLDAISIDLCRVVLRLDASVWRSFVSGKKATLNEILEKGAGGIESELATTWVDGLERESILKKIDSIFSVCRPAANFQPIEDYTYDRQTLGRIDQERHDLVHGELPSNCQVSVNDILFLQQTSLFLCAMVNERFGVQADVVMAMTGVAKSTQAGRQSRHAHRAQ